MAGDTYIGATNLFSTIANTTTAAPATGGGGLSAELFMSELWYTVGEMSFWSRFMGDGPNSIIQTKQDLTKQKGNLLHFELIGAHTDAPANDLIELWGEESTRTIYQDSVKIDMVKHGEKIDVPQTEQFSPHNLRKELYAGQQQWWIEYGLDKLITNKLTGSNFIDVDAGVIGETATANTNVMYGGDATATTNLDETDILTLDRISDMREAAKMGSLTISGGTTTMRKMFPIQLGNGYKDYILVLHPYEDRVALEQSKDDNFVNCWKLLN